VAGNLEAASPEADAQTWLTRYGFSGTVHNALRQPVFAAQITSVPAVAPARTSVQGTYLLCHEERQSYALTISRTGFGELPAMLQSYGILAGVDFWLRPIDDAVVNGQFETGGLDGWSVRTSGSGAVTVTDEAHTGEYAVELNGSGPLAWTAALSQTVTISDTLENPTLSLLYLVDGGNPARIVVKGAAQTVTEVLPSQVPIWTHLGMDASIFAGQTVAVVVDLDGPSGGSGRFVVDEISLGEAAPGVRQAYLPVAGRVHRRIETGYLPLALRAD
jgi:hypothetical protein